MKYKNRNEKKKYYLKPKHTTATATHAKSVSNPTPKRVNLTLEHT